MHGHYRATSGHGDGYRRSIGCKMGAEQGKSTRQMKRSSFLLAFNGPGEGVSPWGQPVGQPRGHREARARLTTLHFCLGRCSGSDHTSALQNRAKSFFVPFKHFYYFFFRKITHGSFQTISPLFPTLLNMSS